MQRRPGRRYAFISQWPFYRVQVAAAGNDTALVFANDAQLDLLRTASLVYTDFTFRVVPTSFYLLFTVFVPYAEHTFPVCFALMTRKTAAFYQAVLQIVRELMPQFQPTQVIADFQEAPTAAVCAVFGNDVAVSGCWFHFARALVKRIRKLGLTDARQNDSHFSGVSCLFCCFHQLVTLCMPAFDEVSSLLDDQSPSETLMQQVIRYVSQQWLNKSTIGPSRLSVRDRRPVKTIIHMGELQLPSRTNNTVESFHVALRRCIRTCSHFLDIFNKQP